MEVDKQLKFKLHKRMQVEFISNNVDVITHDCLSSVALALVDAEGNTRCHHPQLYETYTTTGALAGAVATHAATTLNCMRHTTKIVVFLRVQRKHFGQ